ncbi:hypothetical protein D3C83_155760 [compost metagenome]
MIIHVSGTTASAGWTDAKLAEVSEAVNERTRTYQFVATSPAALEGIRAEQPIEIEVRVDSLPPEVTTIRIVAATNEVSAPIAQ